jgi:chorismate-pyruvate lyase
VADLVKSLCGLFYDTPAEVGLFEEVAAGDLPDQFKALLAHDDHMTVTVEAWHNSLVRVQVLEERRDKDLYARRIVLSLQRDGMPVQYGIMRINLAGLPQIVRMEIESQALPLGHLMRRVELLNLWRVSAGPELRKHLKVERGAVCFGRTARILFNNVPSVELLEIVTL